MVPFRFWVPANRTRLSDKFAGLNGSINLFVRSLFMRIFFLPFGIVGASLSILPRDIIGSLAGLANGVLAVSRIRSRVETTKTFFFATLSASLHRTQYDIWRIRAAIKIGCA